MTDETTDDQPTLDNLLPIGFATSFPQYDCKVKTEADDFATCTRCGGMVADTDEAHDTHTKWHTAIEGLTDVREIPGELLTAGTDLAEERRVALAAAVDASVNTEWPTLIDRVMVWRETRDHCERLHVGLSQGETNRLRRIEQALVEAGAPRHGERDNPGGPVIGWIKQQQEHIASLSHELQRSKDLVDELRKQLDGALRSAAHQVSAIEAGVVDAQHAKLLRIAAAGRRAFAAVIPEDAAKQLELDAITFERAARLIEDPRWLSGLIPPAMKKWGPNDSVSDMLAKATGIRVNVVDVSGFGEQPGTTLVSTAPPATDEAACPSLYLHDGTLFACEATWGHDRHQTPAEGTGNVVWFDNDAVPVPWPKAQEPPEGINVLRDTGENGPYSATYLCRVTDEYNTWCWITTPEAALTTDHPDTCCAGSWQGMIEHAAGDLVVVRP